MIPDFPSENLIPENSGSRQFGIGIGKSWRFPKIRKGAKMTAKFQVSVAVFSRSLGSSSAAFRPKKGQHNMKGTIIIIT